MDKKRVKRATKLLEEGRSMAQVAGDCHVHVTRYASGFVTMNATATRCGPINQRSWIVSDEKRGPGRPRKKLKPLVNTPAHFEADPELNLTEMQAAFVWFYTEGSCGRTEAARRAGFSFPAASATKMMDGKTHPHVTKAIRLSRRSCVRSSLSRLRRLGRCYGT